MENNATILTVQSPCTGYRHGRVLFCQCGHLFAMLLYGKGAESCTIRVFVLSWCCVLLFLMLVFEQTVKTNILLDNKALHKCV